MEDDFQNTARIAGHARAALIADLLKQVSDFAALDAFDRPPAELGIDQPLKDFPPLVNAAKLSACP